MNIRRVGDGRRYDREGGTHSLETAEGGISQNNKGKVTHIFATWAQREMLRSGGLKVRLAQVDCVGEFQR